ncbi:hypothetical protein IVB21_40200 [Bradyrhizobium sp. 18]|nr:hypothetical protein [Bradyrhizobium sp. 18]
MLKIGPQLFSVVILDSEGRQHRCHRPQYDGIDVRLLKPLLLSQRLGNDRPDFVIRHLHRLMILATFSKPRLAK